MSPLRPILIAEDNPHDVDMVRTAFAAAGVARPLVVTSDGEQTIDYLHARGSFAGRDCPVPVALLLDWNMPRLGGREVLRHVRAEVSLQMIPVVVLTSSREESDRVQGYQLGANAYVVKPNEFEAYIAAVGRLGSFWSSLNEPPPASPGRWASSIYHP